MPFYFAGGDFLNKIGTIWFTSYAYYEKINSTHKNWEKVKTFAYRISIYNKSKQYHKI
ncbi:MAG: hypothetical protein K2K91_06880 [Ruminococcus sp.]|nr:hypothetical protein [Ruminococcus sp.]